MFEFSEKHKSKLLHAALEIEYAEDNLATAFQSWTAKEFSMRSVAAIQMAISCAIESLQKSNELMMNVLLDDASNQNALPYAGLKSES